MEDGETKMPGPLTFPAPVFKKLHPAEYLRRFTQKQVRQSGRGLDDFRTTTVACSSIKTAAGSAVVCMGDTRVVAGVKIELSSLPDVVPNLDLGPICSSKYKQGAPGEVAMAMAEKLRLVLHTTHLLDPASLVIEKDRAAWVVYIDILCLSDDGNIFDAAWTSLVEALRTARVPQARFDQDVGEVVLEKGWSALQLGMRAFSTSVVRFDNTVVLADPDDDEEDLSHESATIVLDEELTVHYFSLDGTFTTDEIQHCLELAESRTKYLMTA